MQSEISSGPGGPPLFIASDIYKRSSFGGKHPLAIPRVGLVMQLCEVLGWIGPENYREAGPATPQSLHRFHDPAYVAALVEAETTGQISDQLSLQTSIGRAGNPIFPEVFSRPATACGAALLAVEHLMNVANGLVFVPAGGTHHGLKDRANGFCFLNDLVLAVLSFLDQGIERVLVIDLDAHFGDGTQIALADDVRVVSVSLHEDGRWPHARGKAGDLEDQGQGRAFNLPVPQGFRDSEMGYVCDNFLLNLIDRISPQVIVIQTGCDGLDDDPMSKLGLSNQGLRKTVTKLAARAPRCLVFGGGGYNPYALARCWTALWADLNDWPIPDKLPDGARAVLTGIDWRHRLGRTPPLHWTTTLQDAEQPWAKPRAAVTMAVDLLARRAESLIL